jgi:hypothetical protein
MDHPSTAMRDNTVVGFYSEHQASSTAWRLAVLMGANSRTYKFALGRALLTHAVAGRIDVPLHELAAPYAMSLVQHLREMPQAPGIKLGNTDFLTIAREESAATLKEGGPTERLVDAAVRSMPGMVMEKFHNLAGGTQVPQRFYDVEGSRDQRIVRFTPALMRVASDEQAQTLQEELEARWRIVETSWAAGIGSSLISEGVAVDLDQGVLTDRRRRRAVTGVVPAVIGFQYGRCLICDQMISPTDAVAVDHVFPFSLMDRAGPLGWADLDLDAIWNLAPAHAACNASKSSRPPLSAEKMRLARRNRAIMNSPHPLRKTLELSLRARGFCGKPDDWWPFVSGVLEL